MCCVCLSLYLLVTSWYSVTGLSVRRSPSGCGWWKSVARLLVRTSAFLFPSLFCHSQKDIQLVYSFITNAHRCCSRTVGGGNLLTKVHLEKPPLNELTIAELLLYCQWGKKEMEGWERVARDVQGKGRERKGKGEGGVRKTGGTGRDGEEEEG